MNKIFVIAIFVLGSVSGLYVSAQELPLQSEQQLEGIAAQQEGNPEDDSYLQELGEFKKRPVNLNTADAGELRELRILTDLQVANLLAYRRLLGRFLHLYELQAVPGWDLYTIRKLLPYITIAVPFAVQEEIRKRFRNGERQLLARVSQTLERATGFTKKDSGNYYYGGPQRILVRYRYQFKNLLRFGLLGEKDPGERFFKGAQRSGFDFYSAHFFSRKMGIVEALALGDYTVHLGQGLLHWQGLAFRKSAEIMAIKRQSAVLRPYHSAGEYLFHRGAGISIRKGKLETTVFISLRKTDGNRIADSSGQGILISSILTSGLHRTRSEIADRNALTQFTLGGNISWHATRWQAGLNGIRYQFSAPLQKRDEPYNLYAIRGRRWSNLSMDYSYTGRNFHVFGEAAIDHRGHPAWVNGLLISADPRADLCFFYRNIHPAYQGLQGNAFTENSFPTNEQGIYAGIVLRPAMAWRVEAYADIFRFPWLKFQADAPSEGKEFLLQLVYTPHKQLEISSRYRAELRGESQSIPASNLRELIVVAKQSWRTQVNFRLTRALELRQRVELLWYANKGGEAGQGFLAYQDLLYKPMLRRYSAVFRVQYFDTNSYESRIYAYENDVQYSYSIPVFYDSGLRYYLSLTYDISPAITVWLRWAQSVYNERITSGSGLDLVPGNTRSQLTLQLRWQF